jgi:hypothetical protein
VCQGDRRGGQDVRASHGLRGQFVDGTGLCPVGAAACPSHESASTTSQLADPLTMRQVACFSSIDARSAVQVKLAVR